MTSVNAELAAAIRRVNAAYNRVPGDLRDEIEIGGEAWRQLEDRFEQAVEARHDAEALAAVDAWEGFALRQIEAVWSPETEREQIEAHEEAAGL